jgi:hypothetical protein
MDLSPISGIRYGSYTSTGKPQLLNLGWVPSYFLAWDITSTTAGGNSVLKKVEWFSNMASGSALTLSNDSTGAYDVSAYISTGGVVPFNSFNPQTFAPVALTSLSKATNALITSAAVHGLSVGDSVRLYGMTGAAGTTSAAASALNGLVFSVLTVPSTTTFTIDANTSAFNTAGSGGFLQKIYPLTPWQPKRAVIVGISQANPGVVTTAEYHQYVTGDIVRINIPSAFGMQQLNGQLAEVTVLSATTFSIYVPNTTAIVGGPTPINTTGYTAFAFPSNVNPPLNYAQSIPVGEDSFQVSDPKTNNGIIGLQLGASVVGSSSDVWQYLAILGS